MAFNVFIRKNSLFILPSLIILLLVLDGGILAGLQAHGGVFRLTILLGLILMALLSFVMVVSSIVIGKSTTCEAEARRCAGSLGGVTTLYFAVPMPIWLSLHALKLPYSGLEMLVCYLLILSYLIAIGWAVQVVFRTREALKVSSYTAEILKDGK